MPFDDSNSNGYNKYLIPNSSHTVNHINANDLANGAYNIGGSWTKVGSPVFTTVQVNNNPPASVGPFSGSNYYTQSGGLGFASNPWTVAIILQTGSDITSNQLIFTSPPGDGSTWYVQIVSGVLYFFGSLSQSGITANTTYVVLIGTDNSGVSFLQVNNGTLHSGVAVPHGATGTGYLGNISTTNNPFLGSIIEVYGSTDVPSSGAFNTLYSQITANQALGKSYWISNDANTVGHWSANDLAHGTSSIGPVWTKNGTVALNSGLINVPASVGSFSGSNYYSLTGTSGFNPTSGPYTVALVYNVISSDAGILFTTGAFGVSGLYSYLGNTGSGAQITYSSPGPTETGVTSANNPVLGVNIVIFGLDASNKAWIKLNNGTVAESSGTITYVQGTETDLGNYSGQPATHTQLIEAWASSDVPGTSAFNALYNTIKANLSGAGGV